MNLTLVKPHRQDEHTTTTTTAATTKAKKSEKPVAITTRKLEQ